MALECGHIRLWIYCSANSINTGMKCSKSHSFGLTQARRETCPNALTSCEIPQKQLGEGRSSFSIFVGAYQRVRLRKQHGLFVEILYFVHRLFSDCAKVVLMAREGKPNNSFDTEIASNLHLEDWRSI
ncbi:hypothetical protein EUGRSUZ_H02216 [Eucalyptus grandis]|uniref:Uncharacterized protein n=2 Tax=Eucalyptus grandis TaxID=71139 RepID=A0ACC3JRY2_EUCGR|nr:hypothetical protein EUGRSUZ_H02216 [Eucalyptus grandis]